MKLKNIKDRGRYSFPDGRQVNVKQGRNMQRGTDSLFYIYRGKRIFISDLEFKNMKSIGPSTEPPFRLGGKDEYKCFE